MEESSKYLTQFYDMLWVYIPKIVMAVVVMMVGFWVVKKISKIMSLAMEKAQMAPEVTSFLASLVDIVLKVVVVLVVASILGFELTSLVAVMAAAGFAVGMALQGSLGNFAAGIMILVIKPYRVDEWVEIQEKFGQVESIQIFNTTIVTPGQKTLIIPNGQVMEGVITNYSAKEYIRLELQVTMPYAESYPKVKAIIQGALQSIPEILPDPEPEIGIESYDSHNIIIAIRPYIKPADYWNVTFKAYEKIKEAFFQNGIQVAYSEGVELGPIGD